MGCLSSSGGSGVSLFVRGCHPLLQSLRAFFLVSYVLVLCITERFLGSPTVTRSVPRREIRAEQRELSLRELGRRGNVSGNSQLWSWGSVYRGAADPRVPTHDARTLARASLSHPPWPCCYPVGQSHHPGLGGEGLMSRGCPRAGRRPRLGGTHDSPVTPSGPASC